MNIEKQIAQVNARHDALTANTATHLQRMGDLLGQARQVHGCDADDLSHVLGKLVAIAHEAKADADALRNAEIRSQALASELLRGVPWGQGAAAMQASGIRHSAWAPRPAYTRVGECSGCGGTGYGAIYGDPETPCETCKESK